MFVRDATTWAQEQKIQASDGARHDSDNVWVAQTRLTAPGPVTGGNFGEGIATYIRRIVVGKPADSQAGVAAGAAFFVR